MVILAASSVRGETTRYKTLSLGRDTLSWGSRLSWHTNLVDWMLSTPNVALEIDMSDPQTIGTPSMMLQFKMRPDQELMQFWSTRMEWRWHFRISEVPATRRGWMKWLPNNEVRQSRVVESYRTHRPEMISGRYYLGAYGDFGNFEGTLPIGLHNRNQQKKGWATGIGLSGGYEFPVFSYGNRHFIQLHSGLSLGVVWTKYDIQKSNNASLQSHVCMLPVVSELRFGLSYRTMNIARKYWMPDTGIYDYLRRQNTVLQQLMDSLEANLLQEPLTLYVPSAHGDSTLLRSVMQREVENAMIKRMPSPLQQTNYFRELSDNTTFPISEPGEYYRICYTLPLTADTYGEEGTEVSYVLPFRVRIEGYDEAVCRERSYNDSLRTRYFARGRILPTLYLDPVSSDSMLRNASIEEVLSLMSAEWQAGSLNPSEAVDLFYREQSEFHRIEEIDMNRRGTYALKLRFHPQVTEDYDSLATRFNIMPYISDEDLRCYESFAKVYSTRQFFVPCKWEYDSVPRISSTDLATVISEEMGQPYAASRIVLPDSIRYGRNLGTMNFSKAQQPLQFIFIVEDSVSLYRGTELYETLAANVNARNATWIKYISGNPDRYGPMVCSTDIAADSIAAWLNVDRSKDSWIEASDVHVLDSEFTGRHKLVQTKNGQDSIVWSILRFAYRRLSATGRATQMIGHAAYRIRVEAELHEKNETEEE